MEGASLTAPRHCACCVCPAVPCCDHQEMVVPACQVAHVLMLESGSRKRAYIIFCNLEDMFNSGSHLEHCLGRRCHHAPGSIKDAASGSFGPLRNTTHTAARI